jgi:hypothetical protein
MMITIPNMTGMRTKQKITTMYVTDMRMNANRNHPVPYRHEDECEE